MNCAKSWLAAKSNNFILKFDLYLERGRVTSLELGYYLGTCLLWSFVLTRCCALTWVTQILMRAISNVHTGRRLPSSDVNSVVTQYRFRCRLSRAPKLLLKSACFRFFLSEFVYDIGGTMSISHSRSSCSIGYSFE